MPKHLHVSLDAAFTRRKNRHHIFDENEVHLATHQKFSDVLEWLYNNGHERATFHTSENSYLVSIQRLPDQETPTESEN